MKFVQHDFPIRERTKRHFSAVAALAMASWSADHSCVDRSGNHICWEGAASLETRAAPEILLSTDTEAT